MKIIPASFQIEGRNERCGGIDNIERAGRTCYKSELGDGEKFVHSLINRHHDAMLEHGDYIFLLDDPKVLENVQTNLWRTQKMSGAKMHLEITCVNDRPIISGNIRAWREFLKTDLPAVDYFVGAIDPIFVDDIMPAEMRVEANHVKRIFYRDLEGYEEKATHQRQTVRFFVDRAISHEIVRHRLFSFAQESTRYCNYSQDKFGSEITVIKPCYLEEETEGFKLWKRQCMSAEVSYFQLLNFGCSPQEARAVLPNSLKTELVVTGNLAEWKHFFDLRALNKTGKAHPQMVEVAKTLYDLDGQINPGIFTD